AVADVTSGRSQRADLGDRVGLQPAQRGQVAVLTVAIKRRLGRGQRHWKARRCPNRRAELGQGRLADLLQRGGKDLDLARGRGKAAVAVFAIGGLERYAD